MDNEMIVCAKHQRRYKPEGVCPACKEKSKIDLECEFGHICTSRCQNDIDCPCLNDHYCSMSGEHSEMDCADQEGGCPQHPRPDMADFINDEINDR